MQSLCGSVIRRQTLSTSSIAAFKSAGAYLASSGYNGYGLSSLSSDSWVPIGFPASENHLSRSFHQLASRPPEPLTKVVSQIEALSQSNCNGRNCRCSLPHLAALGPQIIHKSMSTAGSSVESTLQDSSAPVTPRIKFKRLDKTAGNIMRILDQEAVQEVKASREIPNIKPGCMVQLKVEVPENKRRVSIVKGIVIARRNAGLATTFRVRRQVAGVGVESLFHLYSPNLKEIKVLDQKKVRRAKLYYLRDKMNALKK